MVPGQQRSSQDTAMLPLSAEDQLRVYAAVRSLEVRTTALESVIGHLKRTCVHGGDGAHGELVTAASEERWQLRQLVAQARQLDDRLGVKRGGEQGPAEHIGERSPRKGEPVGLRGTTDVIGVPELVSTLATLGKTGTLTLSAGESMFVLEIQEGHVVHAVTNMGDPDLRLGSILVAQNTLTAGELEESLEASADAKELLGSHLVRSATVTEEDLLMALDEQVRRVFDRAFALQGARFTFLEGQLSEIAQRATINTTELLLEAARQSDHRALEDECEMAVDVASAMDSLLEE